VVKACERYPISLCVSVFVLAVVEIILLALYVLECRLLVDMSVHLIDLDLVEILGIKQVPAPYLLHHASMEQRERLDCSLFSFPSLRSWSDSESSERESIPSTGPTSSSWWPCSSSARYGSSLPTATQPPTWVRKWKMSSMGAENCWGGTIAHRPRASSWRA
jgi:hypothetical protein